MNGSAEATTRISDWPLMTRAAGLALAPGRLLLGGLALLSLEAGLHAIGHFPFAEPAQPLSVTAPLWPESPEPVQTLGIGAGLVLAPLRSVIGPGLEIFRSGSSWPELATAWTRLLWALMVWSVFGGAISRTAAIQFAGRGRISSLAALKFSGRQLQNFLTAPLLPLAGIGCLAAVNAAAGALSGLFPPAIQTLAGVLWGVALFCGLLMTMLLVCVSAGWPLMIAAVSTEDSDGFDGLSRANGFLLDRPWSALLLAVLSLPVFALSWLLVSVLVHLTVYLAAWSVAAGTPEQTAIWQWLWNPAAAASPRDIWFELPRFLLRGFGPSFFWCGVTVVYFLLRKSSDGTPLDDVMIRTEPACEETPEQNREQTPAPD